MVFNILLVLYINDKQGVELMNKLFIIDGAAGTGKSDLIDYVERSNSRSVRVIKKYTTRKVRPEEKDKKLDLIFLEQSDFRDKIDSGEFYYYNYGGANYGILISDLEEAISSSEFTFVIVRNVRLARDIMKYYSKKLQVVHIFIYTDRSRVQDRLLQEGLSSDVVNYRLSRTEKTWRDYLENYSPKSKHVILINDSNIENFHRLINELIDEYSQENEDQNKIYINSNAIFALLPSLVGYKENMKKMLNLYPYDKNVFLMMKYRKSNVEIYEFIKEELQKHGYNCIRADEPEWDITHNVYNPIAVLYCCKYGVALFDEPEEKQMFSPNVSYELGIMHAQNKNCLILKHISLSKEPFFDLTKDLYKEYSKEIMLQRVFKNWLDNIKNGDV
jgi:guanylate kinase